MTQIGGPGKIGEVNETHIFPRKYHLGWMLVSESVLAVGAIYRTDKKVCLRIARKRNAEVLNNFFLQDIMPGSTVITDMWRGYNGVSELGYEHLKLNHSLNFVGPIDRTIQTNTIERCWRSLKEYMPKSMSAVNIMIIFYIFLIES
jgi:transposase